MNFNFYVHSHYKIKAELSNWELRFDQEPIQFSARRLEPEKLLFTITINISEELRFYEGKWIEAKARVC